MNPTSSLRPVILLCMYWLSLQAEAAITFTNTSFTNTSTTVNTKFRWKSLDKYDVIDAKVEAGGQLVNSTLTQQMRHLTKLTITVVLEGVPYTLHLQLNKYLFSADYTEKIISGDRRKRETFVDTNILAEHCYYVGAAQGVQGRAQAAFSTCRGISGMFSNGNKIYNIEPMDPAAQKTCISCRHKAYHDLREDDQLLKAFKCGLDAVQTTFKRKKRAESPILDWPQGLDGKTRLIELYVVNDFHQYEKRDSSVSNVTARMKSIINAASLLYHSQDVYLVLIGSETWSTSQKIALDLADSAAFLKDFLGYKDNDISKKHDAAMLITGEGPFEGGIVGKAYLGQMCSEQAVLFICDLYPLQGVTAATAAHEIGHTLGLSHDNEVDGPCDCDNPSDPAWCIMNTNINSTDPATRWSQCSKDKLSSADMDGRDACLNNLPPSVLDDDPKCGNGLVETGEECDCGESPSSECSRTCCDDKTCKLVGSAKCAHGRCCDIKECKIRPQYTECRKAANKCDLAEYCSGDDLNCPSDVYRQDFTPCVVDTVDAYCYSGECRSRESQCEHLWGKGVEPSDKECYKQLNVKGDLYGACGFPEPHNYKKFKPCDDADVMCGTLHCDSGSDTHKDDHQLVSHGQYWELADPPGTVCYMLLYETAEDGSNKGLVPDGAPCGEDKVCINRTCRGVDDVRSKKCKKDDDCSEHGVCNSLDQCHCELGYEPPYCNKTGNGGSKHSNPIEALESGPAGPKTTTEDLPPATKPTTKEAGGPTTKEAAGNPTTKAAAGNPTTRQAGNPTTREAARNPTTRGAANPIGGSTTRSATNPVTVSEKAVTSSKPRQSGPLGGMFIVIIAVGICILGALLGIISYFCFFNTPPVTNLAPQVLKPIVIPRR